MLTAAQLAKASCPPDKAYIRLVDTAGLFIEISRTRARWYVRFQKNGKQSRTSIGLYPQMSLAEARTQCYLFLGGLASNQYPVGSTAKPSIIKAHITEREMFQTIARKWLNKSKPGWGPVHADRYERMLERDVIPRIGTTHISAIKTVDLSGVVDAISARGVRETGKRCIRMIGSVCLANQHLGSRVRRPYVFEQAQILPVPPFQYRSTLWLVALGWRNRFVGEGVRLSDYGLVERCFKDSILRPAWGLVIALLNASPK